MHRYRLVALPVALLIVLAGCESPGVDRDSPASPADGLDPSLAARPEVVEGGVTTTAPPATNGADPRNAGGPSPGPAEPAEPADADRSTTTAPASGPPGPGPGDGAQEPASEVAGEQADAAGDIGLEGPDHADAVRVAIESVGTDALISVEVAARMPEHLGEGEVMGIGVDLFRPDNFGDSDYQVFADGGPEGWYAYLQTPDGFVEYPGRFVLAGSRMTFEIPWSSIGNLTEGTFRAFVDWSGPGVAVVNKVSQDWVPDTGRAAYSCGCAALR